MGDREMRWTTFLSTLHKAKFLTYSEVAVLLKLYRRDARHGKNATGNNCYHSGSRSVNSKEVLIWHGGFAGEAKDGRSFLESNEGSLLSGGTLSVVGEDDNKVVTRNTTFQNHHV
jgi:hypothetical protein